MEHILSNTLFKTLKLREHTIDLTVADFYDHAAFGPGDFDYFYNNVYKRWDSNNVMSTIDYHEDGAFFSYYLHLLDNMNLVIMTDSFSCEFPYENYKDGNNGDIWCLYQYFIPSLLTSEVREKVDDFMKNNLCGPITQRHFDDFKYILLSAEHYVDNTVGSSIVVEDDNYNSIVELEKKIVALEVDSDVSFSDVESVETVDVVISEENDITVWRNDDEIMLSSTYVGARDRALDDVVTQERFPCLNISDVENMGYCYLLLFERKDWDDLMTYGLLRLASIDTIAELCDKFRLQIDKQIYVVQCCDDKGLFYHLQLDFPIGYKHVFKGTANECLSMMIQMTLGDSYEPFYKEHQSYYIDKLLRYLYTYHHYHRFRKDDAVVYIRWMNDRMKKDNTFCPFISYDDYKEVNTYGNRLFSYCRMFSIKYRFTQQVRLDLQQFFYLLPAYLNRHFYSHYFGHVNVNSMWDNDDVARFFFYSFGKRFKNYEFSHWFIKYLCFVDKRVLREIIFSEETIDRYLQQLAYINEPDLIVL